MKNHINKVIIILIIQLFILSSHLFSADINPIEIMKKVKETQTHNTSALDITLTLIETNGEERERRIQTLTLTKEGKTQSITLFLSPASVKQTRFLTIEKNGEDEQWIYLPALKQSKRISGGESAGSFMGSDFSYADMSATTFDQNEAVHKYLETTRINNREVYVIESLPYDTSNYGKSKVWVDAISSLPMRVELYDKDTITLLKILTTQETKKIDDVWVASIMEMSTVATGHKTRIEIKQAKFNIYIPEAYFTIQFLQTGRI